MSKIYLSSPHMGGQEQKYIDDAFKNNWIAPLGPNVDGFEKDVAEYVGAKSAVALSSGTAGIHLALKACGVKQGDYVFCSSLTFSASCNPIIYEGAKPVFIDCDPISFNMSPLALEKAFEHYHPAAVICVNLYGQSADYDKIIEICNKYEVSLIEDAAESLGATYKNKMSGTLGRIGIFSFNGNKIITTSGGGMAVSDDRELIEKLRFWATQSREPYPYYEHNELGYNYRMSNICAGIGRGQMEVLEDRISQKRAIYNYYKDAFEDISEISMAPECDYGKSTHWLSVMTIDKSSKVKPMDIYNHLNQQDIESRPLWKPMNLQPYYSMYPFFVHEDRDIGKDLFQRGLCLPSDTKMTKEDLTKISKYVHELFK